MNARTLFALSVVIFAQLFAIQRIEARPESTIFIKKNEYKSFYILKNIMLSEEVSSAIMEEIKSNQSDELLIAPCANGDFYAGYAEDVPDERAASLLGLAISFAYAEIALRENKYPEYIWKDKLKQAEKMAISSLSKGKEFHGEPLEWLASKLNKTIISKHINLRKITAYAECSVDYQDFTVILKPPAESAFFIPKIFYRFCQRANIDPQDRQACDFWIPPVENGDQVSLAGIYMYSLEGEGALSSPKEIDVDRFYEKLELPR